MLADNQKIIDKGFDAYMKSLLEAKEVIVGVLSEVADKMAEDGDITLYEKAYNNEYGIGVPKRPFMRTSFDIGEAELLKAGEKLENDIFNQSKTVTQALDQLGQMHSDRIKLTITNGRKHFKLNSESWAEMKGGTPETVTPLIHTGQLRGSINFKTQNQKKHE